MTRAIAEYVGAIASSSDVATFVACGSPAEAANVPAKMHKYAIWINPKQEDMKSNNGIFKLFTIRQGKSMVWTNVVLNAPDQLRQRVAWALNQVREKKKESLRPPTDFLRPGVV